MTYQNPLLARFLYTRFYTKFEQAIKFLILAILFHILPKKFLYIIRVPFQIDKRHAYRDNTVLKVATVSFRATLM